MPLLTEDDPIIMKQCCACARNINSGASLCHECGTRQNNLARNFFRTVAILGGIATVLSIVSAGIALAPQAYAIIYPDPRPSIFEMNFDTRDLNTRQYGVFDLYNGGNRDVFATRLILQPEGDIFNTLGAVNVSLYQTIPKGTAVERRIQLIDLNRSRPQRARLLIGDQYKNLHASMIDSNNFESQCFSLLPLNASKRLAEPASGQFRHDIASTTMEAALQYLTVENDRVLDSVPIQDFYIEAAVYFNEACLSIVGGRDGFIAAIQSE